MDTIIPSTPDPTWTALVLALLRALSQIAAGLGLATGWATSSNLTMIASALVMAGTLLWSVWEKYRAASASHNSAVASANSGVAVTLVAK